MNQTRQNITGILLAGGKSSRMGREKGDIIVGERKLYQYPLSVLESLCDEILISSCKEMKIEEHYRQICDETPNIGPIGGIYTCLKKSSNDINIILSYDLPFVKEELFHLLLENVDAFEAIFPAKPDGRPEPLCAIYRREVVGVIEDQIEKNIFAVHKTFPLIRTKTVVIKENLPFYHKDLFLNINDETDLAKFASYLK
jgi:molybdenum cofactor guanylyltransferase